MKRKMIAAILALALCLSLAFTASAAQITFVVDEDDYLASFEVTELNTLAARIYEERGVGIFYVYTAIDALEEYDVVGLVGGMEDYFVMLENEENWYTFLGGKGAAIDLTAEEELRQIYDKAETYAGGVEDFLNAAAEYFPVLSDVPENDVLAENGLVLDDAELLSDAEEAQLEKKLASVSEMYQAQIVVATLPSMDEGDIDEFVEFLYDTMGFGYGEDHDGVLLLVCMDPREYRILSNGFAAAAIESSRIDAIGDAIVPDLSDGNYADAFTEFADQCQYYLDGYLNGFPFDFGKNLMIALVVGALAGLIVAYALKGQLKSVRRQEQANVYVTSGSMQVTTSRDLYLYRDVVRTKKESSSSSDSSSRSSSRNVGGGKF